jgi:hypothetical protein
VAPTRPLTSASVTTPTQFLIRRNAMLSGKTGTHLRGIPAFSLGKRLALPPPPVLICVPL